MARTVDLFIDSDQPIEQVAYRLGELAGRVPRPAPPGTAYLLGDGEVAARLAEHDFVDDEGLPLSEFRYVVSCAVRGPGEVDESAELAFPRALNRRLRQESPWPSLLVVDLERPDPADGGGEPGGGGAGGR